MNSPERMRKSKHRPLCNLRQHQGPVNAFGPCPVWLPMSVAGRGASALASVPDVPVRRAWVVLECSS
jgi:hypothetical protein